MGKRWTEAEDQAIRDTIAAGGQMKDVPLPDRTPDRVRNRAFVIGAKFGDAVEVRRQRALAMEGSCAEVAKALGISRQTVWAYRTQHKERP